VAPAKTLLCYGDSNTYGAIPTLARVGRHRFAPDRRWPGVLRKQLGSGWDVIEEGLPSRTTVHDDPIEGVHKNGLRGLPISLDSHMPIDVTILMLGTNDLKHRFGLTPGDIADSVELLIRSVQRSEAGPGGSAPLVLAVAPPPMAEIDWLGAMFLGGAEKSQRLPLLIGDAARRMGAAFLNSADFIESSAVDGIHLDSDAHRALGIRIARIVRELIEPPAETTHRHSAE
jgi:lysophospholipase L1-like esterase